MILTKTELAARLGLTKTRVSQLVAEGLPVRDDGRVDTLAACAWVRDNLTSRNAAATREAARVLAFGAAVSDAMGCVLREVPFSVVAAAADLGLTRGQAERLANIALLMAGSVMGDEAERAGIPAPLLPHPDTWSAGVNWPHMFGPDGASIVTGGLAG